MSVLHVLLSSSQHTCDATSALGHGSTAVGPPLASGAPAPARVSQMGREPESLASQQAGSVHFRWGLKLTRCKMMQIFFPGWRKVSWKIATVLAFSTSVCPGYSGLRSKPIWIAIRNGTMPDSSIEIKATWCLPLFKHIAVFENIHMVNTLGIPSNATYNVCLT